MEIQPLLYLITCLLPTVYGEGAAVDWCYHSPACSESHWQTLAPKYCNSTRQSPINIVTASVKPDANLTAFDFKGFNESANLLTIQNSGFSVTVRLNDEKMLVSGGGLQEQYTSLQFHLHWGNLSSSSGSEHTVDGKQYPMELHIVNRKQNLTSTMEALKDPTGLAVLGFFIEATPDKGKPDSWKNLTSLLSQIPNKGDSLDIMNELTMDSLLEGLNMTKYYRYLGSLTTPACEEAVVWTVFKDPIKVSQDLIDLFSTKVRIGTNTTDFIVHNRRSTQPLNNRVVTSQPSSANTVHHTLTISATVLTSVLLCWV